MHPRLEELLAEFTGNYPASSEELTRLEEHFSRYGKSLPAELREILEMSDGAEGFIHNHYLMLWGVEEFFEGNKSAKVDEYAPCLILFASNGGGEAYAFDARQEGLSVVQVPFIGMDLKYAKLIAGSFIDFLEKLAG